MPQPNEFDHLLQYAQASGTSVVSSQSDLDPKDHVLQDMLTWCQDKGDIVVLNSGLILTSNPASRDISNAKAIMIDLGMSPGHVLACTQQVIELLLATFQTSEEDREIAVHGVEAVSEQQTYLRDLVHDAIKAGVSDIHLEVRSDITKIRFRKHGDMYLHAEWSSKLGREISAVAFNKETDQSTAHFNPHVPQNASMPLMIDGLDVRLRLASMPALSGFDVVMRVLSAGDEHIPTLEQLGYTEEQVELIKRSVKMPNGAVLLSGPTGSGKTTTLASCISLVEEDRKTYTIEDPIEKVVPTATQVPANPEREDRGFAAMGKATLRMDPDYIVLGEMRDNDTAGVMVRAAITGHLVFSTIHTNSAASIVTRLADMAISPVLLGDPNLLVCLIFQRLIQTLCEDCKKPLLESEAHQPHVKRWTEVFGDDMKTMFGRGNDPKCKTCGGRGVAGRTVVAEVIWVDEPGREFIQKKDTFGWVKYLKEHGWKSYQDHVLGKCREGVSDPLDGEKLVGEISGALTKNEYTYRD